MLQRLHSVVFFKWVTQFLWIFMRAILFFGGEIYIFLKSEVFRIHIELFEKEVRWLKEFTFQIKKTYRWPRGTWKDAQHANREMQIKSTMKYHLTPVRTTTIKKSTNSRCWRGCREKGALLHCWWEHKFVQPLWRTVCRFLKKLEIEWPHD